MIPDDARLLALAFWADALVAHGGEHAPHLWVGPLPRYVACIPVQPRSFVVPLTDSPRPYRAYVDLALVWPLEAGRN
jgi:hypothetical protein